MKSVIGHLQSVGRSVVVAGLLAHLISAHPLAGAETVTEAELSAKWVTRTWLTSDGLPQDSVSSLAQTRDGFLWVGTGAGLARFDGVRFRSFGLHDGLRSRRIARLVKDAQGVLGVGTRGSGVSRWDQGRFTSFGVEDGFPSLANVTAMAADRGPPTTAYLDSPVRGDAVRALCADGETMWIGTFHSALLKADAHGLQVVAPKGTFQTGITCGSARIAV